MLRGRTSYSARKKGDTILDNYRQLQTKILHRKKTIVDKRNDTKITKYIGKCWNICIVKN